uniref:Kinesin-like protein KIN-8B n=1 Tax=Dunaliella tertiolecta TaxID=3047 RepID=A0A7S3QX98_DUNTE|mmetsp:Transcript_13389/g.36300  ORF Transcript_13389/g.36300 Transcript_13389/m.36300 type:complete len:1030 (+) Transcript_13389:167-3256(+)
MDNHGKTPVKLSSVVNAQRYVPSTTNTSLIVGVRVRPLLKSEQTKSNRKDIIRVIDGKVVVVLDPDESKDYLDQVQHRTKEKRYTFDVAFDFQSTNRDVYDMTLRDLVSAVLYGINTTVFAYGATGSGKTYTMVGSPKDPGLMILSLQQVFQDRDRLFKDEDFSVTCTYLEVYNETIYDLLVKNSGPLELREDPEQGVQVAGLKHVPVGTPDDILGLLDDGNRRRKTEATDANLQSSRSHAVLEILVKRKPANHYRVQQLRAKLSLVDLAGSERAAETNNAGQKLRDGASINRSLLALANCINALGKMAAGAKAGANYVPYRNSKLTRLLKDGLSGNSRTAMITTVAAANDQYHHSINTLKYADRAKEIKTHVVQNVGTVESHIADYQRMIDALQLEVSELRGQLMEHQAAPSPFASPTNGTSRGFEDDLLTRIDNLVQDMNENIEERINLQKAVFEIEDANLFNRYELKQLEEFLSAGQGTVKEVSEARDRRADIQIAVRDNERELAKYKAEILANENVRTDIQSRIDRLVSSNSNVAFLNFMRTFRLQAIRLQEMKFQMAVRDQIIFEQRAVISNLWKIINRSGMGQARVLEIARQEGIIMDGLGAWPMDERPMTASDMETANYLAGIQTNDGEFDGPEAGQALSGFIAASDQHAATPNATLIGNRAKMRYRFWSHYPPEKDDSETPESGSPKPNGGKRGALGVSARRRAQGGRMGAGIRVEHILHPHYAATATAGRRGGPRASMLQLQGGGDAGGGGNGGGAGGGGGGGGAAETSKGEKPGGGAPRAPILQPRRPTDDGIGGAGAAGGGRIRSGRRAGMPLPRAPSLRSVQSSEMPVTAAAPEATPRMPGLAARRQFRSQSSVGEPPQVDVAVRGVRYGRNGPSPRPSLHAWAEDRESNYTATVAATRPPAKMTLNERLARLKGRVGGAGGAGARAYTNGHAHREEPRHLASEPQTPTVAVPSSSHFVVRHQAPRSSETTEQSEGTPPGTSSSAPDALDHHTRMQQELQYQRRLSSAGNSKRPTPS